MARNENPPFGRGETFYNLFAATTQSSSDGTQFEGKEWVFEDINPTTKAYRSGQYVTCRAVRNVSGIALLGSRVARFANAPLADSYAQYGGQIDGYTYNTPLGPTVTSLASRGYPIDEFLPTAGLQNLDIGWIVVKGPASCLTDLAALAQPIVIGDRVIAQTAATSQATTAGRIVDMFANTASITLAAGNIQDFIGYAMNGPTFTASTTGGSTWAASTNATNASVLVDVVYH